MKASVIVCTYNRRKLLEACLNTLILQEFPGNEYEIIVVDNNSSDGTAEVIDAVRQGVPIEVRYLIEKRQGLSYARNTGISKAKGKIVAFLDDDALADRSWLKTIVDTFEKVNPIPGCVGGKVVAVWPAERPKWLAGALLKSLGLLDLGNLPRWTKEYEYVWGVNMAFLKQSIQSAGVFEPSLGRKGKSLVSNEEICLFFRLRSMGENIYYQPEAVVHHRIAKEQMRRKWFFRRSFAQGISNHRLDVLMGNRYAGFRQLANKIIWELRMVPVRNQSALEYVCDLIIILGYMHERVYDIITGSRLSGALRN